MIILRQKEFSILPTLDLEYQRFRNKRAIEKANKSRNVDWDKETLKKLKDRIKRTTPINESLDPNAQTQFGGPYYTNKFIFGNLKREDVIPGRQTHLGEILVNKADKDNLSAISHEYGHALDYASTGGKDRFVEGVLSGNGVGNNVFFKRPYKQRLKCEKLNIKLEGTATKNGLKILKKLGAKPKDMVEARKSGKAALESHFRAKEFDLANKAIEDGLTNKEYVKQLLTDRRRLRRDYRKAVRGIEISGRTGAERLYDASKISKARKMGRAVKANLLKNDTVRHAVIKANRTGERAKKKIIKKAFKQLIK